MKQISHSKSIQYIGVDVSHHQLDFAYQEDGKWIIKKIPNKSNSIKKWLDKLDASFCQLVFEPTGTYHDRLMHLAEEQGIKFSMVNTRISFHYSLAQGHTHRNDAQAAQTLATIGQKMNLAPSQTPGNQKRKRKQIHMALAALSKQRQALMNQLHSLDQLYEPEYEVVNALKTVLKTTENQIKELENQLFQYTDQQTQQVVDLLKSVVGIGPKSAAQIMRYLGDLSHFNNSKELIKFTGIAPCSHQSGSSVRTKARISRQGPAQLRATLYMAAISAKSHNLACKAMYERLRARGKPHKQAMVAVIGKLLRQIFAVVKTKTPFDNQRYLAYC